MEPTIYRSRGEHANRYSTDPVALVTQFGVSLNKVNGVIQKITGKTSAGVRSSLLVEAKRVAQCQVATDMVDNGPCSELQYWNCFHQDGTSKFHRHFQSFQITTVFLFHVLVVCVILDFSYELPYFFKHCSFQ